ncbi:MAG TPA: hypothetical protein VMM92_07440 [Thermoanaerobaculia bacterium]|nr:hypothetical protein [Thermoanaerobaculia bacterium]
MKSLKVAALVSCGLLAVAAVAAAQESKGQVVAPDHRIVKFPARGIETLVPKATNLTNHGGPVITSAKVVLIFWGPTFANASSADHTYATTLQAFRNQYGTNGEYNTITQYSGSNGTVALSNLAAGTADWFDTSTPPTAVTDANVQAEVNRYLSSHTKDNNTIYEVVIPTGHYSSDSGSTSCGGPSLAYCAYHSWIGSGTTATKYSIQPYPSCSGCTVSGWTAAQNQEHFMTHETREAVTDPTGSTWYDSSGEEADDKCAWSPTPFLDGSYGYQYEWSNANKACIKTR